MKNSILQDRSLMDSEKSNKGVSDECQSGVLMYNPGQYRGCSTEPANEGGEAPGDIMHF